MKIKFKILSVILIIGIFISLLTFKAYAQKPLLDTIELDGGYKINFSSTVFDYKIYIPLGRGRIPRITATAADGVNIKIYMAALADDDVDGYAYITADDGNSCSEYRIRFIRTSSLGFVLQCDDRYDFKPQTLSGTITYKSSEPQKASVGSSTGIIVAKSTSETPVTITATDESGNNEHFVINKIVKAQIDIVMSVGQSNAYGRGGNAASADKIKPGTAYDIGYDGDTRMANTNNTPISLAATDGSGVAVAGLRQAFANEWYKTTGEKILFINAADPGIKIAAWQNDGESYIGAKNEFFRVVELIKDSEKFEINRKFFYFNHGSADAGNNFNGEYYADVTNCFTNLLNEMGFEFGTIFEYFSSDRLYTTWIRSQHNRIVSEIDNIYMGCEMKPYIQQNPSLINSDMLHLSSEGHNLCGTILARNTAAQVLTPGCKYFSTGEAVELYEKPNVSFDFNGSLSATDGSSKLTLGGGTEKYDETASSVVFSDGMTWYNMSEAVLLTTTDDWTVEFTMRLDGRSTQFAVLGSPDNSSSIYIDLFDGTTKGLKIRYGIEGKESTAITLSVRNTDDFYEMNTWRLCYNSELKLLYLYRADELQSTEILPGAVKLSQIGKTGAISLEEKTALLDNIKFYYGAEEDIHYTFEFENNLNEFNGLSKLSSITDGTYEADSVCLKYSSNNYSFDEITLDGGKDWIFEVRGTFAKNTGILANANGSNTIFANVSDPGFRVRSAANTYVKLSVSPEDFSVMHIWRIEYSTATHKITLYRDGTKVDEASLSATLKFNGSGASGTTGSSNSAEIDRISVFQEEINKDKSSSIIFNFNNSLSDESQNYTMELKKGKTTFISNDMGYTLSADNQLSLQDKIELALTTDWSIKIKAKFTSYGDIIPGLLAIGADGFTICGVNFTADTMLTSIPGNWHFKYSSSTGAFSLEYPDGKIITVDKIDNNLNNLNNLNSFNNIIIDTVGGSSMTIYRLSIDIGERDTINNLKVTIDATEDNLGTELRAVVNSNKWKLEEKNIRYQWLKDGSIIPGAINSSYKPTVNDMGKTIACLVRISGIPISDRSTEGVKISAVSQSIPIPSEKELNEQLDGAAENTEQTNEIPPVPSSDEPQFSTEGNTSHNNHNNNNNNNNNEPPNNVMIIAVAAAVIVILTTGIIYLAKKHT